MSRPIDADALKKSVLDLHDCYNGFSDTYDKACIIGIIDEQPTIEERKKGKWEIYVISPFDGEGCRCSECGFEGVPYWDFCPNCGADMRGEQNEPS